MGYGHNIRQRREAAGMSQAELANAAGISRPSITAYEDERRKPKWETWVRIAASLRCTVKDLNPEAESEVVTPALYSWMSVGPPPDLSSYQYPIVTIAQAQGWDCMLESLDELLDNSGEVAYFQTVGDDLFAVRIEGDSMDPLIKDGDLVLVKAGTAMPRSGQPCIAKLRSGELVCKTWYWRNGIIELRSENEAGRSWKWTKEEFQQADPLEWRFPVVEQNRLYKW